MNAAQAMRFGVPVILKLKEIFKTKRKIFTLIIMS